MSYFLEIADLIANIWKGRDMLPNLYSKVVDKILPEKEFFRARIKNKLNAVRISVSEKSHAPICVRANNILLFCIRFRMATVEDILENQYREGKKIISMSKTSRELLEELKEECPHVPEREIIRLFKSVAAGTKMVDSAIIAAAHNTEYNLTHPAPEPKPWIDAFFTETSRKIITPEKLMKKKKLYSKYIDMISSLEEKYDGGEIPDIAIFKRRTTTFLKENIGDKK